MLPESVEQRTEWTIAEVGNIYVADDRVRVGEENNCQKLEN